VFRRFKDRKPEGGGRRQLCCGGHSSVGGGAIGDRGSLCLVLSSWCLVGSLWTAGDGRWQFAVDGGQAQLNSSSESGTSFMS
jgi:hypothetical protein